VAKRLSELQKRNIVESFTNGLDIKEIAKSYDFSTQTIIKQLKNIIGDDQFKYLKVLNSKKTKENNNKSLDLKLNEVEEGLSLNDLKLESIEQSHNTSNESQNSGAFFEVTPLTEGVELNNQKEKASIPIEDMELPQIVYILVDKKTELETKMLRNYPDWSFMPQEDLERMTLEIYSDQKNARRICAKDQKIIKIPNSEVFLIASKYLKARGISRIIFNDSLIAI
tara:strand:- start:1964 stop:2638 length:675 start_codon:yes stop_codon:yes gene_type:complete